MILVSDSENNLQTLINRAKSLFDFADIKLNPIKCEVLRINSNDGDKNINIDGMDKEYVVSKSFIKFLGVPMGSRKVSKVKFTESKIQKVLEDLDKVEFCGLALNQIIRVI
jgi:hypothetical protein